MPSEEVLVFDLETQRLADEVGGWSHIERMGLAVGVVWSEQSQCFDDYLEEQAGELIHRLANARLVIGFNIVGFDLKVLRPYAQGRMPHIRCFDMLADLYARLGHRVSLDACAAGTLSATKSADGIQAVHWFRQGRIEDVVRYCRDDVAITRDLFHHGCENGRIAFSSGYGSGSVEVDWKLPS